MRDLVKKMLLLLTVATGLALLVNRLSPHGIPLIGQWDSELGVVTANTDAVALWMDFEIPDPETAKQVFDAGKPCLSMSAAGTCLTKGIFPVRYRCRSVTSNRRVEAFAAEVSPNNRSSPIVRGVSVRTAIPPRNY